MTEPPQDDDRRPDAGAQQPYGGAAQQYGQQPSGREPWGQPQPSWPPQSYGQPPSYGPPQSFGQPPATPPQPFNRPYGQPPGAPGQFGPPAESGPPQAAPGQPYGQPGYAPPGYGEPAHGQPGYGQPPKKSRVRLIAIVTTVLLLLIAGSVVAALTLGRTLLDRVAVQRDVAAQFEEREGVGIDLDCPSDMQVEDGATYRCSGTTDDGEKVTLRITIEDAEGARYTWTEV
jgi:hypothetical protein